jgi:hypothetical protein
MAIGFCISLIRQITGVEKLAPSKNHSVGLKAGVLFSGRRWLRLRHALLVAAVLLMLAALVRFNEGYDHVFSKFGRGISGNSRYDSLSYDQRLAVKLGFTARYLQMLRDSVPANAVILMPPDSIFFPKDTTSRFTRQIRNRRWVAYFIHPRKVVYEDEKDTLELYNRFTHVAVVNYWGYDKAAPVRERKRYAVIKR